MIVLLNIFLTLKCYSQSSTLTDLMDTSIISSRINTESTIVINSSEFKIYLNKNYFNKLVRKNKNLPVRYN